MADIVEATAASPHVALAEDLATELLENAAGSHGEFAMHVCQIVKTELAKCEPGDTARIVGTLAGVAYMTKLYASQQGDLVDADSIESAISKVLQQHSIARDDFHRLLRLYEEEGGGEADAWRLGHVHRQ